MKWFEVKEQAAGTKRLLLLWYIYKVFGKKAVKYIAFFVTFFAFVFGGEIRGFSQKYLAAAGIKPYLINSFKHFLSYSYSLIDRMEVFANRFNPDNISFASEYDKNIFLNDIYAGKGVFFICSHLGNIEVLRAFLRSDKMRNDIHVNVFLSENQCKIFNNFIKRIAVKQNVTTFPVENIGVATPIMIKEKLDNGEIAFLAGDRVAETNSSVFVSEFLGKKMEFPVGTFKFAKIMDVPVYYIAVLKDKNDKYVVHLQKAPLNQEDMQNEYVKFLEKLTKEFPLQFYHFYDIFIEK